MHFSWAVILTETWFLLNSALLLYEIFRYQSEFLQKTELFEIKIIVQYEEKSFQLICLAHQHKRCLQLSVNMVLIFYAIRSIITKWWQRIRFNNPILKENTKNAYTVSANVSVKHWCLYSKIICVPNSHTFILPPRNWLPVERFLETFFTNWILIDLNPTEKSVNNFLTQFYFFFEDVGSVYVRQNWEKSIELTLQPS